MKKNNEIKDLILKTSYDLDLLLSRKLKSYNLALTEFNTLKVLNDNGDCTVQNMAKQVLLTSGSMTYIVDNLVAKSCIEKVKQVEDNRVFMLSLTKKGKTLYKNASESIEEDIDNYFNNLRDKDRDRLIKILNRIDAREIVQE